MNTVLILALGIIVGVFHKEILEAVGKGFDSLKQLFNKETK